MSHHEHPLQGRIQPLEGKSIRLFGSIADPASPAGFLTPNRMVGTWQPQLPLGCGCGLMMVQSSVVQITRSSDEGVLLLPLSQDIGIFDNSAALPAGASRSPGRSQVKLYIAGEASTNARRWYQDVGQTVEFNADCAGVSYFVPSNFYEVAPGQPMPGRDGLVVDVYLSVSIYRLEQAVGNNEVIYTQHIYIPAPEEGVSSAVIPVPPFATEVTIYQNLLGIASAMWTQWYGDPSVVPLAVQAAGLPWIAGARRTQQESLLPDVTHLRTELDNSERFYTLRWVIRP